jgi:hypothetical protein
MRITIPYIYLFIIEKGMLLKREDVYIANVVKCRPTVNQEGGRDRPPEKEEVVEMIIVFPRVVPTEIPMVATNRIPIPVTRVFPMAK